MAKFILLEYKDESRSGAQGKIAVWLFQEMQEARAKMKELAKNKLPLALYHAEPLLFFHPEFDWEGGLANLDATPVELQHKILEEWAEASIKEVN